MVSSMIHGVQLQPALFGRVCSRQLLLPRDHLRRRAGARKAQAVVQEEVKGQSMHRLAWHITQPGDMKSLQLQQEAMPTLQPGHVLVEVQAWGLNFADVFCALDLYKAAPKGDFVPGLEFAGTVLEVRADTTDTAEPQPGQQQQQQQQPEQQPQDLRQDLQQHLQQQRQQHTYKPGDRVLGVLRFGAFASHVALPAAYIRPVPKHWTMEQAAAYPVQTLTAAYGLFEAGAYRPGQAVLVQSAAGGVGLQALQILSRCGSAVLGLVGSSSKVKLLQDKYAQQQQQQQCLQEQQQQDQYTQGQLQQQDRPYFEFAVRQGSEVAARQQLAAFLERAGCTGCDVNLDSLGPGPYFQASYDALNPCGRHVIFGAGALTPRPGLRVSLNPVALLTKPWSLWGLLQLGWGWLRRPKLDVLNMPGDNKGVIGFNLIWLYDRLDILAGLYERVDALALDPPLVGKVFGFDQLPDALAYLQSGQSVGKVVLTADPKHCSGFAQNG